MVQSTKKMCSIDGCDRTHSAHGWCWMHYDRWLKYGDPESVAFVLIKDPEEAFARRTEWQGDCLIWVGWTDKNGNGQVHVNGKKQKAHRYAWERINGPIPDGMIVIRKDHCSISCVNVDHLRCVTAAQNASHRSGAEKGSKSGILSVYPAGSKWRVQVKKNGKRHNFGVYDDINEAAEVAQAAREELFGAYAGKG